MPTEPPSNPPPRKRRGWLWRITKWFLWVVLAVILFHRPLVHYGGRWIAIRLAKSEHMDLDLRIGGNLWSGLEVSGVSIRGDGTGPAPIERLTLDRLALDYDLWKAVQADWFRVLREVEVGTLDAVIVPQEPDRKKPVKPQTPIAKVLKEILANPLSPVGQLRVERVDLEVKDTVAIRGFHTEVSREKPGYISWEQIEIARLLKFAPALAELVANDSTIAVGKLPLLPQMTLGRVSLNHGTEVSPQGGVEIIAEVGGGIGKIRVVPSTVHGTLDATVEVNGVRVNESAAIFRVELPAPAVVETLRVSFAGAPEQIETATAAVAFSVRADQSGSFPAATLRGQMKMDSGTLKISELTAESSGVSVQASGEVVVPMQEFDLARLAGEIGWKISGPDLSKLRIEKVPPVSGALAGSGKLQIQKGEVRLTGDIEASKLVQGEVQAGSAKINFSARRKLAAFEDLLATLAGSLSVNVEGIAANGIRVDACAVKAGIEEHRAAVEQLSVTSGENQISGSGRATLKSNGKGLATAPDFDLKIAAPKLDQFGAVVNGAALSGAVTGDAKLRLEGTQLVGNFKTAGTDLRLGKTPLGEFRAQVKFENGAAILDSLDVRVAEAGGIVVKGRVGLDAQRLYSGQVDVNLSDLGKLDALLDTLGHHAKLGGALTVEWAGAGQIPTASHTGKLTTIGKDLRHDALILNELRLGATYSPDEAETTELTLADERMRTSGHIRWKNNRLELSDLVVHVAGAEAVKGNVSVPLVPSNTKNPLPFDQPLSAHLHAKDLDVARLLSKFGIAVPVSGIVSFDLDGGGTLSKPEMKFTLEARSMKDTSMPALAPADIDVKADVTDARLSLAVVAKQRDIQPFTLNASLPLDVEKLRSQPELARELPVQLSAKLPATSLGIVPRLVPIVQKLDGTVAANLEVHGTVAKPVANGEVSIAIKSMRLAQENLPPVSNFTSKIVFHDDAITFKDTKGEIGGGAFHLDGNVNVTQPKQPAFDLRFRSDKVLVLRDEAITVRADTDVTLKGPLNAATAAGTVFVTQSRFFKDVDILPLLLPSPSKPRVRTVATPVKISFPNPPLRDWKFDIAIKTREKDSFLIRGNAAKGAAAINLKLGGTGLTPFLSGHVQVEDFSAVLPASKLQVRRGYVTFTPENPFQPALDIQAESRIRKTTVTMNISGSATAPRLDLTSEPPLPQMDILSLLATGTTTGEMGTNASALATKAALLTVKKWYRKIFGGGGGDDGGKGEESLLDRFEMDIGNVDPKTGRPEVNSSFKINDQFYLLGDIDMTGQFTAKVKYLIRFR